MSGHTKGPWTHHTTREGEEIVQRGRSGGFVVQDADPDRAKADAALIAASPTMLAALRAVEEWWLTEGVDRFDDVPAIIVAVGDVIAEAEGET